jgi:hypothetical protein
MTRYGWFSALMMCGSSVGAATWAARMMNLAMYYKADAEILNNNYSEGYSLFSGAFTMRAGFLVTYSIEFLFLTAAKLMVLERLLVSIRVLNIRHPYFILVWN